MEEPQSGAPITRFFCPALPPSVQMELQKKWAARYGRLVRSPSGKWTRMASSLLLQTTDGHQDDGDDSSFHPDATSDGSSSESSESSTEDNLDDHSLPVVNVPRVLTFVAQFVWALVVILLMQVVVVSPAASLARVFKHICLPNQVRVVLQQLHALAVHKGQPGTRLTSSTATLPR